MRSTSFIIALFFLLTNQLIAQSTAEVTSDQGTWTTKVGENTTYTGSNMADAIISAIDNTGEGVINIRNGGPLSKRIHLQANQTLDFHGNEIVASNSMHATFQDGITIRNLHMTGSPYHSLSFHGCSDLHLHNIVLEFEGETGGIRIDNNRSDPVETTNLKVTGEMRIENTRNHGFETYTIDGIEIEEVVTRNTGGCGVLLNDSRNVHIGLVDAYRADYGGSYAGFRVANFNGPNVVLEKLVATYCGRGFFSVSGSHGTTINRLEITGSTTHGILIQNAQNLSINSGVVWNNNCSEAIRVTGGSHAGDPTRNVLIQNVRVYDDRGSDRQQRYGILEDTRDGTDGNVFLNNDLRYAGTNRSQDLVVQGPNSVAEGNALTGDEPLLPDEGGEVGPPPHVVIGSGVNIESLTLFELANSDNWNLLTNIKEGNVSYGDRDYTFATIPDELRGHEWIQPAMNSRTFALPNYAEFTAKEEGYVYIGHSDRVETKPDWLSEYELTDLEIIVQESATIQRTLSVYKKEVEQGQTVQLGVNSNNGTTYSLMYIVVFVVDGVTNIDELTPVYEETKLVVHPNPFSSATDVTYSIKNRTTVELNAYNLNGTLVQALVNTVKGEGTYTTTFDASALSPGVYVVTLSTGETMEHQKVILK